LGCWFDNFSAASRSFSTICSYRGTLTLPIFSVLGTVPTPCQTGARPRREWGTPARPVAAELPRHCEERALCAPSTTGACIRDQQRFKHGFSVDTQDASRRLTVRPGPTLMVSGRFAEGVRCPAPYGRVRSASDWSALNEGKGPTSKLTDPHTQIELVSAFYGWPGPPPQQATVWVWSALAKGATASTAATATKRPNTTLRIYCSL